ncbi:hypothetical protein MRS44_002958 [Fusarium solani]|uniref:uncharacterized protein n=1 Tax=Fusarium solani TaxID=169388 RepID=UPI0032C3E392|nr:hypothetical protein MRS44_002958 [Fusarium solani]
MPGWTRIVLSIVRSSSTAPNYGLYGMRQRATVAARTCSGCTRGRSTPLSVSESGLGTDTEAGSVFGPLQKSFTSDIVAFRLIDVIQQCNQIFGGRATLSAVALDSSGNVFENGIEHIGYRSPTWGRRSRILGTNSEPRISAECRGLNYALNNENAQETRIKRVKAKTLDDTQGDEADFVFVDYTATSHPGFTTAPFHSRPN